MKSPNNDFRIEYIWDDPGGVSSPELAATWARVSIECGGSVASIIRNKKLGITRGDIYVPLYALAEWFVKNWWFIFNECSSPEKISDRQFQGRHNLAFCNEGVCLPSISFSKNGDDILVKWNTIEYPSADFQFLTSGGYLVEQGLFRTRITQLIRDTIQRLHERGVKETFLENEWKSILEIDSDERSFCEIASRIGVDPFSVTEEIGESLIQSYEQMDPELRDEFYYACSSNSFEANLRWVNNAKSKFDSNSCGVICQAPNCLPEEVVTSELPWIIGYDWAKKLRKKMAIHSYSFDFASHFELDIKRGVFNLPYRDSSIEGLIRKNRENSLSLVLNRDNFDVNDEGTRFLLARALCGTITTRVGRPGVITRADSKFQKINRAFAAELLAPAEQLAELVNGDTVGDKEIQEMKERFLVSEFVITHQLINHGIARVESSESVIGAI